MNGSAEMMFVIDVRKEDIAIKEANRLDIPIVAVVDTNCSPEGIDHVIPGNDDALRAIRLFASRIADAIIEGKQVGTEGRTADVQVEDDGEEGANAPIVESRISIPKEFLTADDVAEIESAEPEEIEEDDDIIVAETEETAAVAAAPAVEEAPVAETTEVTADEPTVATKEKTEESSEAQAS